MDTVQCENSVISVGDTGRTPRVQPVYPPRVSPIVGYVFAGLTFIPLLGIIFGGAAIIIAIIRRSMGTIILSIFGFIVNFVLLVFILTSTYMALNSKTPLQVIEKSAYQKTYKDLDLIQEELYHFKNKFGLFPTHLSELEQTNETFDLPSADGWQSSYAYTSFHNGTFYLRSSGPDGNFSTYDDIYSSDSKIEQRQYIVLN